MKLRTAKRHGWLRSGAGTCQLPRAGAWGDKNVAPPRAGAWAKHRGFTLMEVVTALGLAAIMVTGLVSGYMQSARVAEWSAYSLAANSMALQGVEQVRAAKWDPEGGVDQVDNSFFPMRWDILDIPFCQSNIVYATNRTTITTVSTNPALRMIRVECTWNFYTRGLFTNTIFTYRAPDQ